MSFLQAKKGKLFATASSTANLAKSGLSVVSQKAGTGLKSASSKLGEVGKSAVTGAKTGADKFGDKIKQIKDNRTKSKFMEYQ